MKDILTSQNVIVLHEFYVSIVFARNILILLFIQTRNTASEINILEFKTICDTFSERGRER